MARHRIKCTISKTGCIAKPSNIGIVWFLNTEPCIEASEHRTILWLLSAISIMSTATTTTNIKNGTTTKTRENVDSWFISVCPFICVHSNRAAFLLCANDLYSASIKCLLSFNLICSSPWNMGILSIVIKSSFVNPNIQFYLSSLRKWFCIVAIRFGLLWLHEYKTIDFSRRTNPKWSTARGY